MVDRSEFIAELAQTVRSAKDRDKPAHILIGAGCSKSAGIPLAGELIDEIYRRYGVRIGRRFEGKVPTYGECMNELPISERRDLLRTYLDKAKINWANIAVAKMLKDGFIGSVLNVNFDNVLARACGLLGEYPAIYDFGVAPTDKLGVMVVPSIVHLHGQGYGLKLLNTDEETREHSKRLRPILKRSFDRPLIIVGYSGDSDDIFSIFREEYQGDEMLYWLSHSDEPTKRIREFFEQNQFVKHLGNCDADLTLIELALAIGCWPPEVFSDAEGHLLKELEPVVEYPAAPQLGIDILSDTRTRLSIASTKNRSTVDAQELILKGKLDEAESFVESLAPENAELRAALNIFQATDIAKKALQLSDQKLAVEGLLRANSLFSTILNSKGNNISVLINRGNVLFELGKREPVNDKRRSHLLAAKKSYEKVLELKPMDASAIYNLASVIIYLTYLESDKGRQDKMLDEARQLLLLHKDLRPKMTYNLACVEAKMGDLESCKTNLLDGERHGTLPTKAFILEDSDLESVRSEAWFKELLSRLS